MKPHRIDVHQHVVPPFYASELPNNGGDASGTVTPDWSPEQALEFMDSQAIQLGLLSLTAPGVTDWHKVQRRDMSRRVNEYTAGLVAKWPTRFGSLATLPLPDVRGALAELDYAFDTLKADGVILLSNYRGIYLGDEKFEPLWAELDRRNAVVFVHPTQPLMPTISGVAGPLVDYPFDTTRAAVQLVLAQVPERFKAIRFIFAHAGGFLPYASHRFAELAQVFRPQSPHPDALLATMKSFYFDTALSSGPAVLPTLKAFAGTGNILFGSDYPYAPAAIGAAFTAKLDDYPDLTPEDRDAISHDNALALFPRVAGILQAELEKGRTSPTNYAAQGGNEQTRRVRLGDIR